MTKQNIPFIFARFALFLVYFWFGILKVIDTSPASPLVSGLLAKTMPFIPAPTFLVASGIFEMIIGICFLIPKLDRVTMVLFVTHIVMTIMPLYLMVDYAWQSFFVPTLEGQYIIKNAVLLALVVFVLHPQNCILWTRDNKTC